MKSMYKPTKTRILFQIICLFLILLPSQLRSQTKDLYDKFDRAKSECANCLINSESTKIIEYRENLDKILKKLKNPKIDNGIDKDLLRLFVSEQDLLGAAKLFELGRIKAATLHELINRVIELQRGLSNKGDVFLSVRSYRKWKAQHHKVIGTNYFDDKNLDTILWPKMTIGIDSTIFWAENLYYHKLTPNKTLREIEYFIDKSPYAVKGKYNHNADEAFRLFYVGLTFSGSPDDIKSFQRYITDKKKNIQSWSLILNSDWFKELYEDDLKKANRFQKILSQETSTDDELTSVIEEGVPWEISFVALQRLIKPQIDDEKFDLAIENLNKYKDQFMSDQSSLFVREKFTATNNAINQLYIERYELIKVKGLSEPNKNEIRFYVNIEGNRLALEPSANGIIEVFEKKATNEFKPVAEKRISNPGANVYSFEEKDVRTKGQLNETSRQTYNFTLEGETAVRSSESYDFFIDENVIIFCSYSTLERMIRKEDDDEPTDVEYYSPGFVNTEIMLQELNSNKGSHGKISGNPNLDIYYMVRGKKDKTWSEIKLLRGVNTPFCERSPVLSKDKTQLFFSSEGWGGLGGFDVFWTTIQIDYEKKIIIISDLIHNQTPTNTTADDLYYTPIGNKGQAMMSSNIYDKNNFDIFLIDPKIKKNIKVNREPKYIDPKPVSIDTLNTNKSGYSNVLGPENDVDFSVECKFDKDEEERRETGSMGNKIMVIGRIFDNKKRVYPSAKIIFREADSGKIFQDTIEFNSKRRHYEVKLFPDTRYHVTVYGYDDDGRKLLGMTDDAIVICPMIPGKNNIVKKDFKLQQIDSILNQGRDINLAFFFDFNKHSYAVSNNKLIVDFFQDLQNRRSSFPNLRIILTGFADTIGVSDYNFNLANNRVEFAKNYLANTGIVIPIETYVHGRTNIFDYQLNRNTYLGNVMPAIIWDKLNTEDERRRQLNRRVEIRIKGYN
jgi:outer membrane protein OmpA-like peptidoglycan-associated protein